MSINLSLTGWFIAVLHILMFKISFVTGICFFITHQWLPDSRWSQTSEREAFDWAECDRSRTQTQIACCIRLPLCHKQWVSIQAVWLTALGKTIFWFSLCPSQETLCQQASGRTQIPQSLHCLFLCFDEILPFWNIRVRQRVQYYWKSQPYLF